MNGFFIYFMDGFFRAPRLHAVPALRSSLLLYSQEFALLPFKNAMEIAAVEGVVASIDRHAVPEGQEYPCHGPGAGGRLEVEQRR